MISRQALKTKYREFYAEQKKQLLTAVVAVFIWGLAAHAYGFLNMTLSHDSIVEFLSIPDVMTHKISLGRFAEPWYLNIFHGGIAYPWLNGLLALCWLSVCVWLTAYIFSIRDRLWIVLIAGIFTVNITVTALSATYITDLDADLFAVMLAVIAVFLWQKGGKTAWLGIPLLLQTLGLYQSMLSVYITLVMIVSIVALLQGEKALETVLKGLQAVAIIVLAGAAYLLSVKLSCKVGRIQLSEAYNGLTNLFRSKGGLRQYIELTGTAYRSWIKIFLRSVRPEKQMLALHAFLAVPAGIALLHELCRKTLPAVNKFLSSVLIILLPLGMNISCVASGGMVHHLMLYAAWLIYLLIILLTDRYKKTDENNKTLSKLCSAAATLVLLLILASDVQTANAAYMKKELERQATYSVMTTVNLELNRTENYKAGETDVVFIGVPPTGTNEIFPELSKIWGLNDETAVTYNWTYLRYINYILQTSLSLCEADIPEEFTDPMPSYPQEGYIQWYDDVLVVKISDASRYRMIG